MKKKRRLQKSDAVWLAAVALLVLLQFWWLPGDPGTPDDSYSSTIEGKRGFFQTLESLSQAGVLPPVRRESNRLIPEETCTLVLLSPDRYPDPNEQRELSDFVYNGGTLVFAPNWVEPTCSIPALHIQTDEVHFQEVATAVVPVVPTVVPPVGSGEEANETEESSQSAPGSDSTTTSEPAESEPDESTGRPQLVQTPVAAEDEDQSVADDSLRSAPGLQPPLTDLQDTNPDRSVSKILTESRLIDGAVQWRTRAGMKPGGYQSVVLVKHQSGAVQAAAWQHGSGLVLVSASPDIFSNRAMLEGLRAELAVRLIEYAHRHHQSPETEIVVSEFLNATDAYRGTGILMSPALRSGTLQLIAVALLAGWFGFHRFGPTQRIDTSQRRTLSESATAVGNLHYRTDSGSEAVRTYLEYVKTQLQKMFGRTVHLTDTAVIAARTGLSADDVSDRIRIAVELSRCTPATPPQAAAAIRGLSELLSRLHGRSQS